MKTRLPYEPKDDMDTTWEGFAEWILSLPEELKGAKIWYADLGTLWKGKPLEFEYSPSREWVGIEESSENSREQQD